jgi:hypothetical protein
MAGDIINWIDWTSYEWALDQIASFLQASYSTFLIVGAGCVFGVLEVCFIFYGHRWRRAVQRLARLILVLPLYLLWLIMLGAFAYVWHTSTIEPKISYIVVLIGVVLALTGVATFAVRPLFDWFYSFSPRLAIGAAAVFIVAAAVGLVFL